MGLCAGFAAADFKPICWGKIGLVYQPRFIVHILFVNPTNYIYFPIAIVLSLSLSFFCQPVFSLLPTQTRRQQGKNERRRCSESPADLWHRCYRAIKRKTAGGTLNKGTALCSEGESREALARKIMWFDKQQTVVPQSPGLSRTHIQRFWSVHPPLLNQRSGCKQDEKKNKNKNKESLGADDWPRRTSMAAPTIIT